MKATDRCVQVIDGWRTSFVARSSLAAAFACAAAVSPIAANAADRTVSYEAPYAAGAVLSNTETGTLTLDETAYEATEANALSFTGFESVANSTTVFNGGWWDFGGGEFPTNKVNDRVVTLQNGAVVTNVASMPLLDYYRNKFNLLGGSRFYVTGDAYLDYGGSGWNHSNEFCVAEASTLVVGGTIHLSATVAGDNEHRTEGSTLKVTGEGSYAKAANVLMSSAGGNGAPGDCRVVVTDHGRLDVEDKLSLGSGARSFNNKMYVTDGGVVTAATVNVGASWQQSYDGSLSGYEVYVLNGGVLRANTRFNMGNTDRGVGGMKLIVSNATFSAAAFRPFGSKEQNRCSEFRISGPDAKVDFSIASGEGVFGMGTNNQFIVENNAEFAIPFSKFSYTGQSRCGTVLLRTGAKVTSGGLSTANVFDISAVSNKVVIESGASLTVSGTLGIYGDYSRLDVNDGHLSVVGNRLIIGMNTKSPATQFTNCVFTVGGTNPSVRVSWNLDVGGEGTPQIVFSLPSSKYPANVATSENPIIQCGRVSGEQKFSLSDNAEIRFENATAFAKSHKDGRRDYVLIDSNNIEISDDQLEKAMSGLPETMKLIKTENNLILRVYPNLPFIIIVR